MSIVHLSPAERVILINQFELLKLTDPTAKKYHEEKINALRSGFDTEHEGFTLRSHADEEELPQHRFVHDVLNMFIAIDNYVRKNPTDTEVVNHPHAKFLGFDSRDESEMMRFTLHLVDFEGGHPEQRAQKLVTDGFNSHSPMAPVYRRMIIIWEAAGRSANPARETITAMLTAASER